MFQISALVDRFLNYVDHGQFFSDPVKIFYFICGVLSFSYPIAYIYWMYNAGWKNVVRGDGWTEFTMAVALLLILCLMVLVAVFSFLFWMNRRKQLQDETSDSGSIKALPVWAHFIKCVGEIAAIRTAVNKTSVIHRQTNLYQRFQAALKIIPNLFPS